MSADYDVIVVGAGPAGSGAAQYAASNGASVLLIDRKEKIGEPVACGEFMPDIEEIKSMFPLSEDLDDIFDIPSEYVLKELDLFRIHYHLKKYWDIPFKGYTTDRRFFDKYLAERAKKAGAEIMTSTHAMSINGTEVVTNNGTFKSKVIIGADGPVSKVAASHSLPKNQHMYPAVTSQAVGEFEPIMDMYFGNLAPGAYAWIFPKKEGANVGVGMDPRLSNERVTHYFNQFVKDQNLTVTSKPVGKYVPSQGPVAKTYTDDAMIVGDAAGHVIAVNGGGIPIAMICARIAGIVAAEHVSSGTPLSKYEEGWRKQVYKPLHTAVKVNHLASFFFKGPKRLEFSMKVLGARRMGKILRCRSPFP